MFLRRILFLVALFKHDEHRNSIMHQLGSGLDLAVLLIKTPREAAIDGRRSIRGVSVAPYPRFSSLPTLRAKAFKRAPL